MKLGHEKNICALQLEQNTGKSKFSHAVFDMMLLSQRLIPKDIYIYSFSNLPNAYKDENKQLINADNVDIFKLILCLFKRARHQLYYVACDLVLAIVIVPVAFHI